jgi:hypothetical protein
MTQVREMLISFSVKHTHLQSIGGRSQMGSDLPMHIRASAQDSWQVLTFEGQTCSLRKSFTNFGEALGHKSSSLDNLRENNYYI